MLIRDVILPTWTEPETLSYWSSLAAKSKFLVESGTFLGASTKAMCEAAPDCHIWSVDFFKAFQFNKQVTEIFMGEYIQRGQLELIEGDMDKAFEMLCHMRGKIDTVIIDDGHAKEDLIRDIRNAIPLLKPGGVMCGHDWEGTNDVAQGVLAMLPKHQLTFPAVRCWQWVKPIP